MSFARRPRRPRPFRSQYDAMLACREHLLAALRTETDQRPQRDCPECFNLELAGVLTAANRWADRHGYQPVTAADVTAADQRAVGYVDWASKLCLYVAEHIVYHPKDQS